MESRGEGVQRLGALGVMTTFRVSCGGLWAAEIRNFVIVLTVELGGLLTLCESANVCLLLWVGKRMWSVRPRNGSGDPSVRFLGMASLIGSGMASDSLSSRLADDVPCEADRRCGEGISTGA